MKFLIPPSEGKSTDSTSKTIFKNSNYKMHDYVKIILDNLKSKTLDTDIMSIYGTSVEKSNQFHKINLDVFNGPCSYAIERYTGVVFKNIDWQTLDDNSKNYLNKNFYIFSGLFGLLSPFSLIPYYKLKMNVLSLHKFWNARLTKVLDQEDMIIDMLPQVHRKAYNSNDRTINIDFFHIKNGKKVNAGHLGKTVKGKLIRYICENKIEKIDDFSNFNYDGFVWDGQCIIKE